MGYSVETGSLTKTELSKYLKILRVQNNETQSDMAKSIGITAAYLSSIEAGKRTLPIDFEDKIINLYHLDDQEKKAFADSIRLSNQEIRMVVNLSNNYNSGKKDVIKHIAEEEISEEVIEKLREILGKR